MNEHDEQLDPVKRVAAAFDRAEAAMADDPAIFLELADREGALAAVDPGAPLAGATFVVKDNIDVAGLPTTAGFAPGTRMPVESAPAVARLVAAGATCLGKVNLDQFATGLDGTRTLFGVPRNPVDRRLAPGGSSSGSAVAVARGIVDFSLGTDTAGSGRVPAAQCRIVGVKPTRGLVPTRGVVPAIRALDCVSVFATTVTEASAALATIAGYDPADPWSRAAPSLPAGAIRRVGVPASVDLDGPLDRAAWEQTLARLAAPETGVELIEVDIEPLIEAGLLLYGGPWVAARVAAIGELAADHPDAVDPTVASILAGARGLTAVDVYAAEHRLAVLRRAADLAWAGTDAIVTPTTPGPATVEEVEADRVGRSVRLGRYTNGVNLLDRCVVSIPGVDRADGWPTGLSLVGPAWSDSALALLAARLGGEASLLAVAPGAQVDDFDVVVVGAHLSGMSRNAELTDLGGVLVEATTTAPRYRLYALAGTSPPRPGLVHVGEGGVAIPAEVWRLPMAEAGRFVAGVPAPLAIGTVELVDGTARPGFVCEPRALEGAEDITSHGGWRAYIASLG